MSSTMIAVLAAATVQVTLLVVALRRWSRTPADRFTLGRWPWLAIILLLSAAGPIAFLVAGRAPTEVVEAPRAERAPGAVEDAVAGIYGPRAR
ncbi:PLDc N-terminal domain-containing protein [Actinomyces timonensis]|uniref:PLDc N-terminal domain-containing protein n=1 Tax=Actinomyces timonensis TaxID=1288391 RepID=A0AAU8N509_9ACTO